MIKTKKYYESLDKRTKEYKEWAAAGKPIEVHELTDEETKSMGLGDAVEKVTKATGIKSVVEHLYGEDCGCEDRKNKLNAFGVKLRDLFRTPKIDFLQKEEYLYLKEFKSRYNGRELKREEQIELLKIHNRVFNTKRQMSTCTSCLKELCNKMIRLYDEHK